MPTRESLVGRLNGNLHPSGLVSLLLIDFSELDNWNVQRWEEIVIETNKCGHDRYQVTAVLESKSKKKGEDEITKMCGATALQMKKTT